MPRLAAYEWTSFVDSYLGQLSPTELQQYRSAQRSADITGANVETQAGLAILKQKFGWDDKKALAFMRLSQGVIKSDDVLARGAALDLGVESDSLSPEQAFELARGQLGAGPGGSGGLGQGDTGENTDDVTSRINKFLADLDPNSPQTQAMYQYISKRGQATQGAASARAGLGSAGSGQGSGGLSAYGQQMVQGDLANKYDLQRKSLQAQGVGLLNQRDLGLKGLEQGYMQMQNQQQEQAWAAKQNQAQGIGAAIGGGLGALGFIGGPALGAATMRGGAALGGGLGGLAAGGSGPSYPSMPSWMSGSGRKGSLGGSGY